jgi:hypothetical protein
MALLVEVGFGDFHPLRVSRSIWMGCGVAGVEYAWRYLKVAQGLSQLC